MPARGERLDADPPALEVADAADRLVREQLVAADMQAAERDQRQAGIEMVDDGAGEAGPEVDLTASHHLRRAEAAGGFHVLDIGEAFGAQELLGDVQGGEADPGREGQADRGRLRRPFVGE